MKITQVNLLLSYTVHLERKMEMKSSEAINIAVSCVMTSGLRMPEKREVIDSLRKMELETEELERKLSDVSELIETESYTDHIKCQDVVCITPLLEVIEFEE